MINSTAAQMCGGTLIHKYFVLTAAKMVNVMWVTQKTYLWQRMICLWEAFLGLNDKSG